MNCYRHSPLAAVGVCKTCFKALCPDCAADVGNGLACKGECEQKVRELNQMWERSAKIYGIGEHRSRVPATGVLLWGLMALVMWGLFAYVYFVRADVDVGVLVMAVFFTAALGLAIYGARRTGMNC